MTDEPRWLVWSRRIQAIAQTGLTYTENPYDRERYAELRELALEIACAHVDDDRSLVRSVFAPDHGYPTPKVDVRALVLRDREVLLVRERSDGRWALPGGWADVGLSIREVAAKEVLEESGYDVRPVRLLAVWDRARHNPGLLATSTYKVFVDCELTGGEARTSAETSEVRWFPPDALPDLSTGRVTAAQVARLLELHLAPDSSADFD